MKIVILFDQAPSDAEPDLADNTVQAEEIGELLRAEGHRVEMQAMTLDRRRDAAAIKRSRPDLVFNLVEAPGGQGRFIADAPALLEELKIPYTGAGPAAMRSTSNKLEAKNLLHASGLPTPSWLELEKPAAGNAETEKYIIKSVWEHGSVGLGDDSVVDGGDIDRIFAEMEKRRPELGGECFAEEFVDGREFNVSLLTGSYGPEVLPPAEILFNGFSPGMNRIVGYDAKWSTATYEFNNTPRTFQFGAKDGRLLKKLEKLSQACWSTFKLEGWARIDFRANADGEPMILEINANPCLASNAGFMASAARRGLKPVDVLERIIGAAFHRGGVNRNGAFKC